jgi:hypothetical protein
MGGFWAMGVVRVFDHPHFGQSEPPLHIYIYIYIYILIFFNFSLIFKFNFFNQKYDTWQGYYRNISTK